MQYHVSVDMGQQTRQEMGNRTGDIRQQTADRREGIRHKLRRLTLRIEHKVPSAKPRWSLYSPLFPVQNIGKPTSQIPIEVPAHCVRSTKYK